MSAQPIEAPPTAEETQRRGHMAALAVAEHIVAVSPVVPTDVNISCSEFAIDRPTIEVHFYNSATAVQALAEVLGGTAATRPHRESDPRPYTEANLVVSGVPVKAWSLAAPEAAQGAAVAA